MKRPKDVLKWVAAGFALVATASAEYELARAIGMHPVIAAAVPGALDAYAVRALRAHREVFTAVLAMVGVNAASHLVTAGVLHVGWPLITAVSAIAPLVLWRVHALSTRGEVQLDLIHDVPVPAGEPSKMQTCSRGCQVWGDLGAHERAHELSGFDHPSTVPDHVPDEWNTVIDLGVVVPPDEHANVLPFPVRDEHPSTADTGVSDAVGQRDRAALLVLRTHMADEHLSDVPGVRDIKKICKVSTDRARRVRSLAKGETQ